MLPTCIGISGVSRYRNDASIEDSFLASAIFSSRSRKRGALAALLASRMSLLLEHIPKTAAHPASIARRAHSKSCPYLRALVRIVHFQEARRQWQTARTGQNA